MSGRFVALGCLAVVACTNASSTPKSHLLDTPDSSSPGVDSGPMVDSSIPDTSPAQDSAPPMCTVTAANGVSAGCASCFQASCCDSASQCVQSASCMALVNCFLACDPQDGGSSEMDGGGNGSCTGLCTKQYRDDPLWAQGIDTIACRDPSVPGPCAASCP